MKNFKLLLATTAILSTGALMVNAAVDDETVVPVRAELVHVHNLNATPIDFGRIAVDDGYRQAGDWIHVFIDSSGIVTYREESTVPGYILSNGEKGVVKGADCEQLDFDGNIDMSIPNPAIDTEITANAGISCKTIDGEATFYGTLSIGVHTDDVQVPAGNYTGSLTVTEIDPEP